jgi:glycosyltransferase involved in cell wall biosynthesis
VVPSPSKRFSVPAVEHMASGTPLVASDTGALPEVTGDAAVLVTPGDAEALFTVLSGLLDSPEERARLGAAAWQRVQERFTWSAVARATVQRYHHAIDDARIHDARVTAHHAQAGRPAPEGPAPEGAGPC